MKSPENNYWTVFSHHALKMFSLHYSVLFQFFFENVILPSLKNPFMPNGLHWREAGLCQLAVRPEPGRTLAVGEGAGHGGQDGQVGELLGPGGGGAVACVVLGGAVREGGAAALPHREEGGRVGRLRLAGALRRRRVGRGRSLYTLQER